MISDVRKLGESKRTSLSFPEEVQQATSEEVKLANFIQGNYFLAKSENGEEKKKIEVSEFDQLFGTKEFPKSHHSKQSHHSIFFPPSATTYVQREVCRSCHNHNQCTVSRRPKYSYPADHLLMQEKIGSRRKLPLSFLEEATSEEVKLPKFNEGKSFSCESENGGEEEKKLGNLFPDTKCW
ncbi:hypothetical protein CEXT_657571 [Caerostris extrusa]|uniref:Uncharacterized protein n=1 Tax=Caerostris extrusa TaxID=172846 RepID=A0AAV4W8L7_CAEEX|nr:hypothetical protein CEXT_657571 [Caerostris extrusa]